MLTATIDIDLKAPHSQKQRDLITFPGNVVAFCGRRFGKTDGNVQRLFYWMERTPGLYWWVGLSWRSASLKRAWRETSIIARRVLRAMGLKEDGYINNSRFEIVIPGLGEIWFRTADNPSSLAGEGIKGAVLDEFSLMSEIVWTEYIQATLLDYSGWASFTGVPKGNNWASYLWRNAVDKDGWIQIHATSYDNPILKPHEIDKIRDDPNTPDWLFRQEYLAEIVDLSGGVFRRIAEATTGELLDQAQDGRQYIAGVDVATLVDYTVVSVFDVESKAQVYLDRFNRCDYSVLEDRLAALYARFKMTSMTVESNSIGQSVIEALVSRGLAIQSFTTTSATKQAAIQALQAAFEHGEISILPDPVQVGELQSFEGERTPSGAWKYSAPEGMHDDTVMAMAIAWQGFQGWWTT